MESDDDRCHVTKRQLKFFLTTIVFWDVFMLVCICSSTIRDKIIPHAVSWFTGEAVESDFEDIEADEDDEDGDGDKDEEEEDEDDEEEEEEDEGKSKRKVRIQPP